MTVLMIAEAPGQSERRRSGADQYLGIDTSDPSVMRRLTVVIVSGVAVSMGLGAVLAFLNGSMGGGGSGWTASAKRTGCVVY